MSGRSPYARYEKRPYQYSQEYREWRHAVMNNDDAGAREANVKWQRRFNNSALREAA